MHYEGLLDRKAQYERMLKLDLWMQLAKALGTDLIQTPSNFLSPQECTDERSRVARIGLQQIPPTRFAYEALCWGTYVNTWDVAWDIVKEVDMDNFEYRLL
ncbi:hypothetical protein LTR70_009196 [Exophiala xenobiotica]|uniref:Uncharacterized protein n=1 Tax=Lithohypha guttulata TaxID=1690604 RepID=A0ABR0JVS5_9EURO|nr:hypothetical protein LTR24_009833 [Lithohypha guttulata]KAK5310833.1 hypothetical protein LTR70_009196 [Exophiala xenobiotica]